MKCPFYLCWYKHELKFTVKSKWTHEYTLRGLRIHCEHKLLTYWIKLLYSQMVAWQPWCISVVNYMLIPSFIPYFFFPFLLYHIRSIHIYIQHFNRSVYKLMYAVKLWRSNCMLIHIALFTIIHNIVIVIVILKTLHLWDISRISIQSSGCQLDFNSICFPYDFVSHTAKRIIITL
jgi:hypothetical protein